MKKITCFSCFTSLIAVLAVGPAWAATEADAAIDHANIDDANIVVTASRTTTAAREIGSAVSVITSEEIRRNQTVFLKDILQQLAGVQITSDRPGDNTGVSIRGSDNDQVLWLIDGIELGDPSSTSTQFSPDHLTSRDVARVEVLRGNQSSLYGSDAIGGVINIITQRATEDGFKVNAEAEAGSHGTVNGGATLLGKSGPIDFRLTATGYSHDGPSLADPRTAQPAGSVKEKDGYWRYGFSGRVGVAVTDTFSLQAVGLWQDSHSDLDGTTKDNANTVRKREHAVAVQGNYLSTDGNFAVDANVSRYVARRLYFGPFYSSEGDLYRGTKDEAGVNLSYNGGIWSIAAGGNWEEERTTQITSFSGDFGEKIDTKSAFGELALRPIENLTITGAARIDDNSRFGSFDTYRGTIAYVIPDVLGAKNMKLRASYGTGAKAPGLYQLFDPQYGNPALQVETSLGGDIGFDIEFERFAAQLSYFFARTKNEIVFDGSIPPSGGYAQYGRTRKDGVEIAFQWRPIDALRIEQSFTFLSAETDPLENGNYADMGRPKRSGSTAMTLMPVDKLSLTARARYRSRNASSYGGVTDGYEVFDLLGSFAITPNIEIYGRVTNLFDSDYQMSYGKNTLGRSAYGGVRVSF